MAKRQACLLSFCQVHIRNNGSLRRRLIDQDKKSDDSDHQDVQVEDSLEESEHDLNIHVMIHHI